MSMSEASRSYLETNCFNASRPIHPASHQSSSGKLLREDRLPRLVCRPRPFTAVSSKAPPPFDGCCLPTGTSPRRYSERTQSLWDILVSKRCVNAFCRDAGPSSELLYDCQAKVDRLIGDNISPLSLARRRRARNGLQSLQTPWQPCLSGSHAQRRTDKPAQMGRL